LNTLNEILEHKLVAIIRGAEPGDLLRIAIALQEGGIKLIEITLNSPDALKMIEKLSAELAGKMSIGAGTVLNAEAARAAISAGAKFIISPVVDEKTIRITKEAGVVSIPGAYSPTEILLAHNYGGEIIKLFPASQGAQYMKDILAPLSHIRIMPTGGITLQNIRAYHDAGAVAFGIGTALVNTGKKVNEIYLSEITSNARQFVEAIQ